MFHVMKSNRAVFLIVSIVMFSCTKSLNTDAPLSSATTLQSINSSASLPRNTKFGSSIGGSFTSDQCVSIVQSLNLKYVRMTIAMSDWNGKSFPYENYVANGIQPIVNLNYSSQTKVVPFPTDTASYRQTFDAITNKYQPELIVVENEEINPHYHSGPMRDYINMLRVALSVCHVKGIHVTNGGIYGPQLEVLTYRYLQTKSQGKADSFANNCMYKSQVKAAQNPGSNPGMEQNVRQLDTLLNFYHNLDYVNVHLYEVYNPYITDVSTVTTATPVVVADIQQYLKARTGRPVITNETTPRNNDNPSLVTSVLTQYAQLNFPYVIWYSNSGEAGGVPLYDLSTGALYPNGTAFSNFQKYYQY
jgi:hypothetical protein